MNAALPSTQIDKKIGHTNISPIKTAFVSIIIPTLNEFQNINPQISSLRDFPESEIIFVDGGSSDGTQNVIKSALDSRYNIRLIDAVQGRSRQMNAAAKRAKGEWLIFLHADTILPFSSFCAFLKTIKSQNSITSGAFSFHIHNPKWQYRYLEFYVQLRSRLLKLPFGDQAIFVKRSLFSEIGKYREDFFLMEDVEFVQRLNKRKGFTILNLPIYTSARRFEADGYLKRTCSNLCIQLLYTIGVHPKRLAKMYWKSSHNQM